MQIRFHLDKRVNYAVAAGLRRRGIDVTTDTDAKLIGADDTDQLAFAHSNGRMAVSHDSDFLRLAAAGAQHAGIAYCHQRHRTIGQIIGALVRLWRVHAAEDMHGQITFLYSPRPIVPPAPVNARTASPGGFSTSPCDTRSRRSGARPGWLR